MGDNKQTEKLEGIMQQHLTEDELNSKIEDLASEQEYIPYGALSNEKDREFDIDEDMS